jgi:hypothetical protein
MSVMRFDTMFFLVEFERALAPEVWPGELTSGEWIEPKQALTLWMEDAVTLAMPTLHALRVLAAGGHTLESRLRESPEANGVPSRHVDVRRGVTMVPLRSPTLGPATHTNAVVIGEGDAVIVDPGSDEPAELESLYRVADRAVAGGGRVLAVPDPSPRDHTRRRGGPRALRRAGWAHWPPAERPPDRAIDEGAITSGRTGSRALRRLGTPAPSARRRPAHALRRDSSGSGTVVSPLLTETRHRPRPSA